MERRAACPRRQVDPPPQKGETGPVGSLGYLAAVNVVIWVGLFFYLWRLDRRISEKERGR
jgi:CcmD family protein